MDPKRIFKGQRLPGFPSDSYEALRQGEFRDRALAAQADRTRKFASEPLSCANVQLAWTGEVDLPPGSVVALTDPIYDPADIDSAPFSGVRFQCELASEETAESGPFAITTTPMMAAGATYHIGFGYIPNSCWAQVTINDEDDDSAELADAQEFLSSTTGGRVPIIWKPTGTGVKWCVVQLAASNEGSLLIGQATSTVTSGTATFNIDNIFVVEGSDPRTDPESASETVEVKNSLALALDDNHLVFAKRNKAGAYETWASAGEGGSGTFDMVHFEIKTGQELNYDDTSCTATVLSSTDGTTGDITITNANTRFTGLAGYRGFAYFNGSVWHILSMEGPARFADCTATARSDRTADTITVDIDYLWGNPPNGVSPSSSTGVTIHKLPDHDTTIEDGDKLRAVWNEKRKRWELFWFDGLRLIVKGTIAGSRVTAATSTFTLATPTLVNGWRLPTDTITVVNDPPIDAEVDDVVEARHNLSIGTDPLTNWDTGSGGNFLWKLRGIGGYNEGLSQTILQDADNDPEWTEAEELDVITELTSLAITGGELVLTYKKATVRVVKVTTAESTDTVVIAVTECE